jgi:hypothetical protein
MVTDGVNPGDTVVTDGQDKLQRGSHIEPRNATRSAGSTLNGGRHRASNGGGGGANMSGQTSANPGT